MAGDVEIIPTPNLDDVLSEDQLGLIYTKLYNARPKWFNIGLNLGIPYSTLDAIKMQSSKSETDVCEACLREMLYHRLHFGNKDSLTWEDLCACLQAPTVGRNDVAKEINDWIEGSKRKRPHPDSQKYQAQKRSLIEVDMRNEAKWNELKSLFKKLSLSVRDSLLHKRIQPQQLSDCLIDCYEDEPILKSTDIKIFRHIKEEFDDKESMEQFWSKIQNFISFFSFKLLKTVIEDSKYIDESFKQKLKDYEEEFRKISLDIVKDKVGEKNMSNFLPSNGTTKIIVKVREKFRTYSDEHVDTFKENLASALKVTKAHLHLIGLKPGCTVLTYNAPLYIEATAFPLRPEQEEVLVELGVIWLICGNYQFPSQGENLDPPDPPDSDDDHPETQSWTLSTGDNKNRGSHPGGLDQNHPPGKQLQSSVQDTYTEDETGSMVSQRTDMEPTSVVVGVAEAPITFPTAPPSDSGLGSIVSVKTSTEKKSRFGASVTASSAIISAVHAVTKDSIHSKDSALGPSTKACTEPETASTSDQDIMDYMNALEEEYCELTQQSESLFALKMPSIEDKSPCILHEIMICCQFISKIYQMKVVEDKQSTDFILAAKSGDLKHVKISKPKNVDVRELEVALRVATQAGHLSVVKYLAEECSVNLACESVSGATPLHIAACNGNEKLVEYILSQGVDPLFCNRSTVTPIHCACISNNTIVVKALVKCAMPHETPQESILFLNVGAEISESLLHCAVWAQNLTTVQYLISELGASCNITCSKGLPPFFLALATGNVELVSYLTSLDSVDINAAIQRPRNVEDIVERIVPIHVAAFCGHEQILQHLISMKTCNATCQLYDNGATALHLAIANGHLNCVKYLLEVVADFKSIYKTISPALFWEESKSSVVHLNIDKDGHSKQFIYSEKPIRELSTASEHNYENMLFSLLSSLRIQSNQHLAIFSLLTKMGYEHSGRNDEHLNSPLHYAAMYGDLEAVKYIILELGISPNLPNKHKVIPVHFACAGGHKEVVEFFFQLKQANNHQVDDNDWTVLHYAALKGHLQIVTFLAMEQNYDIRCRDVNGYTPAIMAAHQGHFSVLNFFVKALNHDINSDRTNNGKQSIHFACQKGHLNVVKYLVEECNCDRMSMDNLDSTPLHYAAANGHNNLIKYLSESGCDVTYRNRRGDAPLHLAASQGHLKTVRLLIDELHCEKEEHTISGFTPLHHAASQGHLSVVKYLTTEKNCDIMRKESSQGNTPAQLAASRGHLNVVKFFCTELNYDVCNDRNNLGRLPIHNASLRGHTEVVKYLVEDCSCSIMSRDQDAATPMHCAAVNGHIKVVKYLHNHGCDVLCKDALGQNPLHLAAGFGEVEMMKTLVIEIDSDVEAKTNENHTALHCAVAMNQMPAIRCLTTELNCDVKCTDIDSHTPLQWAVSKNHLDIVKFFVDELNYDVKSDKNKLGQQAIHVACFYGHIDVVKYLVEECKSDLKSEDSAGFTPLHFAAIGEHAETMMYLHSKGSSLVHMNKNGEAAIHIAARLGKIKAMKFLVNKLQCDVETVTDKKRTPLHIAASVGQLQTVEYLTMKLKCQTMSKDEYGYTPAHLAVSSGHLDILKLFTSQFDYNVNSDINNLGLLPIHSACIKDHVDTIKYLIEECGSDKMSRDIRDGSTPLHCAAACGHNNTISYLYSKGCNIEDQNKAGETPLHVAASHGKIDTVKFLVVDLHCDQEPKTINCQTPLHRAAIEGHVNVVKFLANELKCNVMCRDVYGYTPAQLAILKGQLKILKFFVKNSMYDVNKDFNSLGQFAIHTACLTGHMSIVKYLVEECCCDVTCKDKKGGNTPLHLATENRNIGLIKYLVSKGCNKDAKKDNGFTPLHQAVSLGLLPVAMYLAVKIKCDITKKDINGNTPVHVAAMYGHFEILKFFTEKCRCKAKNDYNNAGQTLLHSASRQGHTTIVRYLIEEAECDPMSKDRNGNTPLHFAAMNGHNDVINYLHEQGCDVMCRNSLNETPLHLAAENGQLETVKYLIVDLCCDREAKTLKNQTPLHRAAAKGYLPVIKYLTTEFNFEIICKDRAGNSPAHLAVINGHLEILEFFAINFNYNVNDDRDTDHALPIHAASFYGHTDIAKYIIEECSSSKLANSDAFLALSIAVSKGHHEIVTCLHSNGYDANHKDENGVTVLHSAAERGQLETVKFLISELKCDKNAMNIHNQTPLHCAATHGHLSVVKYLTTELHCDILCRDHDGDTSAHCAVSNGHLEVVKFCVKHLGYDAHTDRNGRGRLPIHSASLYGRDSTLEYLVEELGCDIMSKDNNGTAPMHYAAASGRNAIIVYLLKKGCSLECRNKNGDTPLHVAAEYGRVETVRLFVSSLNCDKETKNYKHHTPLHHAASMGRFPVVSFLAAKLNCDIMSKDCDGDTPLQCAVESGQTHIVKYFVEKLNYDIHSICNNLLQSALHYAALKGHLPIVKYLISQRVDPSRKDVLQNLPLHYAAALGHYKIVNYLVSHGSPVTTRGIMGRTAADIAKINGHSNIQQLLDCLSLSLD